MADFTKKINLDLARTVQHNAELSAARRRFARRLREEANKKPLQQSLKGLLAAALK